MSEIVFNDKNNKPDDRQLSQKIGSNFKHLKTIKNHIIKKYGTITEEWKFYGQKYGWQLKHLLKKRNLFFIIPYLSYFRIVFIFGDRAVEKIEKSDISGDLKEAVLNARKYAEGRGLSIDVKDGTSIEDIKKLIEIKINN